MCESRDNYSSYEDNAVSIVWFRQDLRLSDNLALSSASEAGIVLPIYILDDDVPVSMGSASRAWLYESLCKLNDSLGGKLNFYAGKASIVIEGLLDRYDVRYIAWNKCYAAWNIEDEERVASLCKSRSIRYESFNSNYIWSPESILKKDGSYYKVFSAYRKQTYFHPPRGSVGSPNNLKMLKDVGNIIDISDFDLVENNRWHGKVLMLWDVGETAARKKLDVFIKDCLSGYGKGRDYPSYDQTSRLSAHLHFGEISPVQVWESVKLFGGSKNEYADVEKILSELTWREFSCYLLYHFPLIHSDNFNSKFDRFGWSKDEDFLELWKRGATGYPLVDAGMRELYETGYMHNRVRMVVASFLVKNLNIDWNMVIRGF